MVHVHQARGQSAVDVFRGVFPNAPGRAEAATLAFDRSYRLAVDRSGLAPMDGAADALAQIRESGVRVCLITGLSRSLVGLVLDTLGWWRRVDLVLCPEDSPRGYPWPDPMLSAMLRLGVGDVQDTAYAGGTESGVLCGRAGRGADRGRCAHRRAHPGPAAPRGCYPPAGQRRGVARCAGRSRPVPETRARPRRRRSRLPRRSSRRLRESRHCRLPGRRRPRPPGRMRRAQARRRRARLVLGTGGRDGVTPSARTGTDAAALNGCSL